MSAQGTSVPGHPKAMLIGDQWLSDTGASFESVNPATGAVNHVLARAGAAQVDQAVDAAWTAVRQPGWRGMLPHQRAAILHRIADGITRNAETLARLQMLENGKVWRECMVQAASAAAIYRYYAGVCETLGSEVTPSRGDYFSMLAYEPYGVVAAITPWNSPLTLESQKIAPALAAGNAIVLKPSEVTSSPALEIARIAREAGLPAGILNVVTGLADAGRALVEHPGVRMISFTGGTASGRAIAASAGGRLVPVALELGGKSPHIVFDDADQDAALEAVIQGIFEGSGQSCIAGSRLFVQRGIAERFVQALVARAESLRVDLPEAEGAQMGPIATFAQRDKIEELVQSARDAGGRILTGGRRPDAAALARGAYYLPTVIGGLDMTARVTREEIFGPVLCVLPFDTEEDLIAQANDTDYGLASGIWTADYKRAWRVGRALEAGTVWINTYKQLSISTPFGGFKQSGMAREKGISGVRLYQQPKGMYFGL